MNHVLKPSTNDFVLVCFDDILIYGKNREEHLQHIRTILEVLRTNNLFLNAKKCGFLVEEFIFLGFVISAQGVSVDFKKVQAVKHWLVPSNVKEVKSFHDLATFYK